MIAPGERAVWACSAKLAPYRTRSGEVVTVLRPLTAAEADLDETGPMYRVGFADGEEVDAFADELIGAGVLG